MSAGGGCCLRTAHADRRNNEAKGPEMNARQTTEKHAQALTALLARMQAAATEIPRQPLVTWGHAEQMRDALQYTVYAAFAMGVVSEDESRELGFPC